MGQVQAAVHHLRTADRCFRVAEGQVRTTVENLRAEERYGGSVIFLYIVEIVLLLTTIMLVEQDVELGQLRQNIEQL